MAGGVRSEGEHSPCRRKATPPLALSARGAGGPTLSSRTTQLNGLEWAFSSGTCHGWGGRARHGAVHEPCRSRALSWGGACNIWPANDDIL